MSHDPLVRSVIDALAATADPAELRRRLASHFASAPARAVPAASPGAELSAEAAALQSRIGLADILDDSILSASPGDQAFPLRLFFGELVPACATDDAAFALASGLNLYFRAVMGEEPKIAVGMEVSRLYYTFARASLEPELVLKLSPLLAQLLSTQLDKTALEAVDHQRTFDSASHERAAGSDTTRSTIKSPLTFLCRVSSTGRTRFKAMVRT